MSRAEDNLNKAAKLLTDMRSSVFEEKLAAVQQIPFIADQIGPERTVNELLPFLPGFCCSLVLCFSIILS